MHILLTPSGFHIGNSKAVFANGLYQRLSSAARDDSDHNLSYGQLFFNVHANIGAGAETTCIKNVIHPVVQVFHDFTDGYNPNENLNKAEQRGNFFITTSH